MGCERGASEVFTQRARTKDLLMTGFQPPDRQPVAVSKTVEPPGSVGSNPTPSAGRKGFTSKTRSRNLGVSLRMNWRDTPRACPGTAEKLLLDQCLEHLEAASSGAKGW